MSSIAWAESLCDPVARHDIALANRIVRDRRPFTDEEAVLAARLFPIFGRRIDDMSDMTYSGGSGFGG
jgi:hypothetical protein